MKWSIIFILLLMQAACAFTPHKIIATREVMVDTKPTDKNMWFLNRDTIDVTNTTIKCT